MTDFDKFKLWIGKTETQSDQATRGALRALMATLDYPQAESEPSEVMPPGGHWLCFPTAPPQSELGADGHARRGSFLPPIPLRRRMWAGSRLEFLRPLEIGQAMTKTSQIIDVSGKEGSTGPLIFVRVRHEICVEAGPALIEEQDIVYCDIPTVSASPSRPEPASVAYDWAREVVPDPVLLFRYSALTFNGHRIHYDRRYATDVEGYPGLVVHGPLIATFLLDLLRRHMPGGRVQRFRFRAIKPTFDISPFGLRGQIHENGNTVRLWAQHTDGTVCMDAIANLAEP